MNKIDINKILSNKMIVLTLHLLCNIEFIG